MLLRGLKRVRARLRRAIARLDALPDERERGAQLAAAALENAGCLLETAAMQQEHRELEVSARFVQRFVRVVAAASGKPPQDVLAPPHELLVAGLQVHHEAFVYASEQDHHQ